MPKNFSPAALTLMARGITHQQIARVCDVSSAAVSRWLSGVDRARDDLYDAVAQLGGSDLVPRLRGQVEAARAERVAAEAHQRYAPLAAVAVQAHEDYR